LLVSKVKKNLDLSKFEKKLKRQIHMTTVKDIDELDKPLRNNVARGTLVFGDLYG
jgi:hypothetical protein